MSLTYSLPPWAATLARHGEVKVRVVRTPLPQRMPGAAIISSPVIDVVHVNPVSWRQRLRARFERLISRFSILEPVEAFDDWWAATATATRKRVEYHARHALTMPRFTDYPTQWWPTLATSGNAWDIYDNAIARVCVGQPYLLQVSRPCRVQVELTRADHS